MGVTGGCNTQITRWKLSGAPVLAATAWSLDLVELWGATILGRLWAALALAVVAGSRRVCMSCCSYSLAGVSRGWSPPALSGKSVAAAAQMAREWWMLMVTTEPTDNSARNLIGTLLTCRFFARSLTQRGTLNQFCVRGSRLWPIFATSSHNNYP